MPIDPRVQFVSDAARISVLAAYASRRAGKRAERLSAALTAFEADRCTHVHKALRLGESGLGCRRCAAAFVYEGHAEEANQAITAQLDQEEATQTPPILADFGEIWIVPIEGPCAAIPRSLEQTMGAMTGAVARVVGVRTDIRVQLGVELRVTDDAPMVYVMIGWLLANGRRVS